MFSHLSSIATMSARYFSILIFQMRDLKLRELKVFLESHTTELGFLPRFLPANLHLPGCGVVNPSPDELINNPQYHKYLGQLCPSKGGPASPLHLLLP